MAPATVMRVEDAMRMAPPPPPPEEPDTLVDPGYPFCPPPPDPPKNDNNEVKVDGVP